MAIAIGVETFCLLVCGATRARRVSRRKKRVKTGRLFTMSGFQSLSCPKCCSDCYKSWVEDDLYNHRFEAFYGGEEIESSNISPSLAPVPL
jgi:hypothetical protein